jgi:glycerophosphoryl diester phosphodiesterase
MIDEYKAARSSAKRVWPQSFSLHDVRYWVNHEPRFGKQAVYLDERIDFPGGIETAIAGMNDVAATNDQCITSAPGKGTAFSRVGSDRVTNHAHARASVVTKECAGRWERSPRTGT